MIAANGNGIDSAAQVDNTALKNRVRELRLGDRLGNAKGRNNSSAWFAWLLCFLMAAAWASLGVRWYKNPPAAKNSADADGESASAAKPFSPKGSVPATIATSDGPTNSDNFGKAPAAPTDEVSLEVRGYIIPAHQIAISPIDVSGRIVELMVEEGKRFEAGAVLAKLEDTSYKADRDEAAATSLSMKAKFEELKNGAREQELQQAQAELAESQAVLRQTELDWKRSKELRANALAIKDYEMAESNYESALRRKNRLEFALSMMKEGPRKERIAAAEAEYLAAKAREARAEWRLKNCTITAPVTGIILSKKAEIGSLINPVVGGVSTSLCEMADLSDLEVELDVQERDLSKVFVGQACKVRADAFSDRTYDAYLDRMLPIANRAKGVLPVRVKIVLPPGEEQGRFLKPEMGANVSFRNRKYVPAANAVKAETVQPKGDS